LTSPVAGKGSKLNKTSVQAEDGSGRSSSSLFPQFRISVCMHHRQDFRELTFDPKGDDAWKTFHRAEPNISIYDRELFGI